MAAAAGNDENCDLELDFLARWKRRYSLPPLTTVAQLKHLIFQHSGIVAGRVTLNLMPYRTTMDDGQLTVASYGILAGEASWISVDIAKITVLVRFTDYSGLACSIPCYEFDSVGDLRRLIVGDLLANYGLQVWAGDLELSCGGAECRDEGAPLFQYGVEDMSWVDVKIGKGIRCVRRRYNTSAL